MSETDRWVPDTSTGLKDLPQTDDVSGDGLPLVWNQVNGAYVLEQLDTPGIKDGAVTWNKLAQGAVIAGLDARAYGFVADGVNDDGPALQAAIAAADAASIAYLYLGQGTSGKGLGQTSVTLNPKQTGMVMDGAGAGERESSHARSNTVITWIGAANGIVMDVGDGGTTTVFDFELRNIAINGGSVAGVTGVRLNQHVANSKFEDVLVYGCDVCWDVLNFCFANEWTECAVYGFTSRGWKLRNGNHNSKFDHCKGWGNNGLTMVDATPYTVEIGAEGNCSGVSFEVCDFEAWQVTAQVKVQQANGVSFLGGYMELKDAVGVAMIDFGGTGAVNWAEVAGGTYIANTNPNCIFKLTNVSGGRIAAFGSGGSLTSIVKNVTASGVRLSGKYTTGIPLADSYVGVITDAMLTLTDLETLVDQANVVLNGLHSGGILASVSQGITVSLPTAAADGHTYMLKLTSAAPQTIAYDAATIKAGTTVALPAATTGGAKTDYLQFRYNLAAAKWDFVGLDQGL